MDIVFFFSLRKVVHHYSNKFPQIASTRSEAEIMNQLIHYLLPEKVRLQKETNWYLVQLLSVSLLLCPLP